MNHKDINWFKKNVECNSSEFEFKYSFFENGDFGNLNRVEFEGKGKGGNIDFWDEGWMEIHMYDYSKDKEILHVLLEPNQEFEKDRAIEIIKNILQE